jgi:DNA-binding GntR family transcriptional regulator
MSESPRRISKRRGRRPANLAEAAAARQARPGRRQLGAAPRLYQRILDILSRQIESSELPPGARLQESVVAALFGVSRAPVRQALAELQQMGVIEKAAGQGYTVCEAGNAIRARPLDIADTEDLRLVPTSSWERIYGEVESEIAGRIAFGGWRVNEAELARYYHVSRTVARDVMGRLQQRGVVRKDDRSRWYAPALTPEHVGELYEMRWLLEPVALVKAAPNVPPGFLAAMKADLDEAIANARTIGGETLDRLETELHIELLGYSANQTLMQAITLPQSLLIAHRFLYRSTLRLFETEPFLPEHLDIVTRLAAGHVEKAAAALEHHLRVSLDRAMTRVEAVIRDYCPENLPYLERMAGG